jgi:hypothetical protein
MQPLSIVTMALATLVGGAGATVLAFRLFPLWLLVAGQEHGRFAGLGKSPGSNGPASRGGIRRSASSALSLRTDRLIVV